MQLPERATFAEAPALLQTLQQALDSDAGPVRIDASKLQAFDTSAVALLLHARRLARNAGRPFEVVGAPPKLAQLAQLYGVEALLSLSPAGPSVAA
jgi:phospholipid transport system transporter-binding protein